MRNIPLGELVTLRRGASYKGSLVGNEGIPLLGLGTIQRNGRFKSEKLRRYAGDSPERMRIYAGDLYVSLKDMTQKAELLGAVSRVPGSIPTARLTQDTIALDITDRSRVSPEYLYASLLTPRYREFCRSHGTGTTNLDLSQADFLSYEINYVSVKEQDAITTVLGALDDKIAVNTRILEISNDLLRDHYRRLPIDSSIVISDVATEVKLKVDPSDIVGTCLYIGLEHFDRKSLWLTRSANGDVVTSTKTEFRQGDTLFGKLRPYFHKVSIAFSDGICSTDVLAIRSNRPEHSSLVAAACASDDVVAQAVRQSNGTRMPRAKWADIGSCPIPDPESGASHDFRIFADAVIEKAKFVVDENQILARTRDELLPLLMDGRITVRQAEDRVGEVH